MWRHQDETHQLQCLPVKITKDEKKSWWKSLYVTCDYLCFRLTRDNMIEVEALKSTQEEADIRVIFHTKQAVLQASSSIMIAEDTDILLLCLAFHKEIYCHVYVKCGTAIHTRYISISKISAAPGEGVCGSLFGLHALSGCDTVSAFSGRVKLAALKLLMTTAHFQDVFSKLGQEWQLTDEMLKVLEEFTCRHYVSQSGICDLN